MKLVVAILSDIHLTESPSHPFVKRLELIAAAIGSSDFTPDGVLLIFGGDLVDKGLPAEYAAMERAIERLKDALSARFPGVMLRFFSVPGNHDLLHPEDSEPYRKNLIEGSRETLREIQPNPVYLSKLLEPQNSYNEFAIKVNSSPPDSDLARICQSVAIPIAGKEIRLDLINSALLSQLHEQQGGLILPMQLIRRELEDGRHSSLSITVMHHPLHWIESTSLIELREFLGRTSDYVLTGHLHFSSGFEESSDLGPNLKYYESPAFFDSTSPNSSAFRVLVFDLDGEAEKQLLFRWKTDKYVPDSTRETNSNWAALVHNRALRPTIRMNLSSIGTFNNPGFAYVWKERSPLGLEDLFVYPDIRATSPGMNAKTQVIKGTDVIRYLTVAGVYILQGASLCGKTSISKKLVLDVRKQNDAVPVWLNGQGLAFSTIASFEEEICRFFEKQYSKDQLEAYRQLSPEQRLVIIDDWHLAKVSPSLRREIYDWLSKFSAAAILLVDDVFQVKEAISTSPDDNLLSSNTGPVIKKVHIGNLSSVSKAALIHNWLRSRDRDDSVIVEESREAKKVEDLVSALLGKDSLPAYAFFVLCILQALESKKTPALAGGSFGPLFEVLLFSALEKANSDDLEISTKLVFMQEIAYYMWLGRLSAVSREKIEEIARAFELRSLMTLPVSEFLLDLEQARVVTCYDGNYCFSYPHYFYYSVARYIRDHSEDEQSDGLKASVDHMIDNISSAENSTILMFLIYFEKDKHRIIDRIVHNAALIYSSVPPARLENDAVIFSSLQPIIEVPQIEESPDIAKNRNALRVRKDEQEDESPTPTNQAALWESSSAYGYSDDLSDVEKLHLSQQTTIALGQVIRNFSANLDGSRKVRVLKETYLLGLRSLGRVMDIFSKLIERLATMKFPADREESIMSLRSQLDQAATSLTQIFAVGVFENISNNIGVPKMELAYSAVSADLDQTVALRLISITVQLHHFSTFPETEVRQLHRDIKNNKFALGVLQWLVWSYLLLQKVEPRTQKNMARLFNLDNSAIDAIKV